MLLAKFFFGALLFASMAQASVPSIEREQIKSFRSWIVTIVEDQLSRGPNPRWNHRDCSGLLRFAVRESLARHDSKWRKANGFLNRALPAELELSQSEREKFKLWKIGDNQTSDFARALPLIQRNADFIGKTTEGIEPGDILFFDQGDDQHIMIWTGKKIIYHNGHRPLFGEKSKDNGLRGVSLSKLLHFQDTRWQPRPENPNFIGFYRLSFLKTQISNEQGI